MNNRTRNQRTILYWIIFAWTTTMIDQGINDLSYGVQFIAIVVIGLVSFVVAKSQIDEE